MIISCMLNIMQDVITIRSQHCRQTMLLKPMDRWQVVDSKKLNVRPTTVRTSYNRIPHHLSFPEPIETADILSAGLCNRVDGSL